MIPIVIIEGPTASGKTALALALAEHLKSEIISADSRQVYKQLDIGTAKPSPEELSRVKHHLIDIINPDKSFNAGLFRTQALAISKTLSEQGKIPVVCGGTGLYIKALLEGLFKSDVNDPQIRSALEDDYREQGLQALYDRLCEVDNQASQKISSNDKQRIMRALEVWLATGIPLSEHWQRQERSPQFKAFRIFLNEERDILYKRIDERVLTMLENGLIEEIKSILGRGYGWYDPGFDSVGYKEFRPYLETGQNLDKCTALAQQNTRNYAKRQLTWYRKCKFNSSETSLSIRLCNVTETIQRFMDTK
ncbi:MAG: tRNA (adenosine(37)-N6)-dimethylallyltransferase MiaA [Candidatus Cloacimonadaceae bacterium]